MPLPSAVTSAIGLPLPSVKVTVLPGSAVPLRLLPLLRLTVGVAGAMASTVVLPWPPVLPAGSVAVALTTVPSASGVDGVKLQLPLPSAVTCPMGLPLPSVRVTVAPGSAVPLISAPLLGLTTGAAGATESTVVLAGALVLPVGSLAVALTTVPLGNGVPGVKQVLKLERVGLTDNFFELGGHSLLATQVLVRVREQLGLEMALKELFEFPVLTDLARQLEGRGSVSASLQDELAKSLEALKRLTTEEIDALTS